MLYISAELLLVQLFQKFLNIAYKIALNLFSLLLITSLVLKKGSVARMQSILFGILLIALSLQASKRTPLKRHEETEK